MCVKKASKRQLGFVRGWGKRRLPVLRSTLVLLLFVLAAAGRNREINKIYLEIGIEIAAFVPK